MTLIIVAIVAIAFYCFNKKVKLNSLALWFAPWMLLGIVIGLYSIFVIPVVGAVWFLYGLFILVMDELLKNNELHN